MRKIGDLGPGTIERALQIAAAHQQAGRLPQAEVLCREILSLQPQQPDALHLLGMIAYLVNRDDVAVDLVSQAISNNPHQPAFYLTLGEAHRRLGRNDAAVACFQRALAIYPNYPQAHYNLGVALHSQKKIDEAMAWYGKALALQPNYAEAHNNLGAAFYSQGRFGEAIACSQRALEINPAYPEAHSNIGIVLAAQGDFEGAIACFQKAVNLRPDFVEAWHNLAVALYYTGRFAEAIICDEKALALQPGNDEALNNLGNIFKDQGHLEKALKFYREAVRLNPKEPARLSNLLFSLHLNSRYDAKALLEEHGQWEQRFGKPRRRFHRPHTNKPDPDKRLKIGYVSSNPWNNPVGRFLLPLFENHQHEDFEILSYLDVSRRDPITTQMHDHADSWRETFARDEEQLAAWIREDGVDVLVDLSLHTGGNRLTVFARKPAPVQVTYLAYCSTSGLKTMNYRLTDPYLDPPGSEDTCYSETSLRLPETYWCYPAPDEAPEVTPPAALSAGFVTFGCLNNFCKVNPTVLTLWARLMRETPGSRLVLYARQGSHRGETQARLAAEGVSPERVRFVDSVPLPQYFANHAQADIALDPFPYAGGTTSCDALWMGVPLVTLAGKTAVGRGGVSILSNLGLPELIAHSEDEYVQIAVALAHDLPRLAEMRTTLRARMGASPLMDAPRFARGIEAAYRTMWQQWCAGQTRKAQTGGK